MKNIEVEVRSFISLEKLKELRRFFDKYGRFIREDFDETVYFKAKKDLRIRKDNKFSYLILKEGKIHDKYRKEIEIKLERKEFENLENLLSLLGFKVGIRWYRRKRFYIWKGINVYLWITKGYGYMVEFEKITNHKEKDKAYNKLKDLMESLNIKITPRKEMEKKFLYYKRDWKKLTRVGSKKIAFPK